MKNKKIIIGAISSVIAIALIVVLSIVIIDANKKIYTVDFNSNGGSRVQSIEVKEGKKIEEPQSPTKKDYAFAEWQTNGITFDFDTKIEKNLTLHAVWNDFYTVEFDTNGGTEVDSQIIEFGKFITPTNTPVKENYTFHSWELDGVTFTESTPVTSDIVLTAVYDYDVSDINTFIDMFSRELIEAEISINGTKSTLSGQQLLKGNTTNGMYAQFEEGSAMYRGSSFINGSYCFIRDTNESVLPLYLTGYTSSNFNSENGVYTYNGIAVTYISKNNFKIEFNDNTYLINLKRVNEIEVVLDFQAMLFLLFNKSNNTAIVLDTEEWGLNEVQYLNNEFTYDDEVYIVTELADFAFHNSKITSIMLNENLEKIGASAFESCVNLTKVDTSKTAHLQVIDNEAFRSCSSLSQITLPNTMRIIGDFAFMDCKPGFYSYHRLSQSAYESLGTNWVGSFGADGVEFSYTGPNL
ncbi:MAG: InlB B-repeat-containing protein [bacterium]